MFRMFREKVAEWIAGFRADKRLSVRAQRHLLASIDFRLAMKAALDAEQGIPGWVLKRIIGSADFVHVLKRHLNLPENELDTAVQGFSSGLADDAIRQHFASNPRLKLLISEGIDRYNDRLVVLAGLRSRLERWLAAPSAEPKWPKLSRFSGPNPVLGLGLAGVLGFGGFIGVFAVVSQTEKLSSQTEKIMQGYERYVRDHNTVEIDRRIGERLEEIRKAALNSGARPEIRIIQMPCQSCSTGQTALKGTVSLEFPKELPQLRISGFASVTEKPQKSTETETGASNNGFNLNVRVSGMPPFPDTFRIVPNYKLENQPPSLTMLNSGKAASTVIYPVSYTATTACPITVAMDYKDKFPRLSWNVGECSSTRPPQILELHGSSPVPTDGQPTFIPELGASVRVERLRTGFLGLGKGRFLVSIEAVPFSPAVPAPAQKNSGSNAESTASLSKWAKTLD